jgi:hypothetical protein
MALKLIDLSMSEEKPPTEKELGSSCRPEVYLHGLLNDCRLEGDKTFTGCPFAHYVGKNRFCKHPSLLYTSASPAGVKPEDNASVPDSKSNGVMKPVPPPASSPENASPRIILQKKCPQLLERIELMWGSLELHAYFKHSSRKGLPPDVLLALDEIDAQHRTLLKAKGKLLEDIQDKSL